MHMCLVDVLYQSEDIPFFSKFLESFQPIVYVEFYSM